MNPKSYPLSRHATFLALTDDELLRLVKRLPPAGQKALLAWVPPAKLAGFRPSADASLRNQFRRWKQHLKADPSRWRLAVKVFVEWVNHVPSPAGGMPSLRELLLQFNNDSEPKALDDVERTQNSDLDIKCFRYLLGKSQDDLIDRETIAEFYNLGYFIRDPAIEGLIARCRSRDELLERRQQHRRSEEMEQTVADLQSRVGELEEVPDELRAARHTQATQISATEAHVSFIQTRLEQTNAEVTEHNERLLNAETGLELLRDMIKGLSDLHAKGLARSALPGDPAPPPGSSSKVHPSICSASPYTSEEEFLRQLQHCLERWGVSNEPPYAHFYYVIMQTFPILVVSHPNAGVALREAVSPDGVLRDFNVSAGWIGPTWIDWLPANLEDLKYTLATGSCPEPEPQQARCPPVLRFEDFDRSFPEGYLVAPAKNLSGAPSAFLIAARSADPVHIFPTATFCAVSCDLDLLLGIQSTPEATPPGRAICHVTAETLSQWAQARLDRWNSHLEAGLRLLASPLRDNPALAVAHRSRLRRALSLSDGLLKPEIVIQWLAATHLVPLLVTLDGNPDRAATLLREVGHARTDEVLSRVVTTYGP
jgi:hypothetical protein